MAIFAKGIAEIASVFILKNWEYVMHRPEDHRLRWRRVAATLLIFLYLGGGLNPAHSASERQHIKPPRPSEQSSLNSELPDPMEMVRDRLKSSLKNRTDSEDSPSESLHPEDLEMEHIRVRLIRRLSMPGELHLTLRSPSASATLAARRASHPSNGPGSRGRIKPEGADRPADIAWSYQGNQGPAAWARISPEFALCGSGKRQSPVDLRNSIQVHLEPLSFEYQSSEFKVRDDGRGIHVQVAPGSVINLRGQRYELKSIRFHTPAQEHIEGKIYDMSAELLHRAQDGRMLVVVLMFEKGEAHSGVQQVLNHLPLDSNEEVKIQQPVDWVRWWPPGQGYYIYMGSLTEPPCTEGVLRVIMKNPATVSAEQMGAFSRIHPMNARPVQPMAGRLLKETP